MKTLLATLFCVDVYLLLKAGIIHLVTYEQIRSAFPALISSSSIIVAILVAYFLNRFSEVKHLTKDLKSRYVELQRNLFPYLQAFDELATDIVNRFQIDAQYPKAYNALRGDTKFWENDAAKPAATIFVRDLYECSKEYYLYRDYETDGRLISSAMLFAMSEHLSNLSGTLGRRKHYKYVLRNLGFDESLSLDKVIIANSAGGFKNLADALDANPKVTWDSLSFWEDQINKALEIVEKMIRNHGFRNPYFVVYFRSTFVLLSLVLIFGTLIPILLMAFSFTPRYDYFLAYFTVIGFIPSLLTVLTKIFSEVIREMKGNSQ